MASKKNVPRQTVIVSLSNGKKGVFEGIAIAWPDEIRDVTITDVIFMVPTLPNPKNVTPTTPPTPPPAPHAEKPG
jgi:hypothetical protein